MNNIKKNTAGFTLVEIIVVLVILAILAAAAIPTMLGFVEDAKMKSQIADARLAYTAAQMIATEEAAQGNVTIRGTYLIGQAQTFEIKGFPHGERVKTKLEKLIKVDNDGIYLQIEMDGDSVGKIGELVYVNPKGGFDREYKITIKPGERVIVEKHKSEPIKADS